MEMISSLSHLAPSLVQIGKAVVGTPPAKLDLSKHELKKQDIHEIVQFEEQNSRLTLSEIQEWLSRIQKLDQTTATLCFTLYERQKKQMKMLQLLLLMNNTDENVVENEKTDNC